MDEKRKLAGINGKLFVNMWCQLHIENPDLALAYMIGSFATIYAMMSSDERFTVLCAFDRLAIDIGDGQFEDGTDFLNFLDEKINSV